MPTSLRCQRCRCLIGPRHVTLFAGNGRGTTSTTATMASTVWGRRHTVTVPATEVGLAGLASAKHAAGTRSWWGANGDNGTRKPPRAPQGSSTAAIAAVAGCAVAAASGFHEGLWAPLLRDAQSAAEAAAEEVHAERKREESVGRKCASTFDDIVNGEDGRTVAEVAAERLSRGEVVAIDDFVSTSELAALRVELSSMERTLRLNPKVQAGNTDVRTDRVGYIRPRIKPNREHADESTSDEHLQRCLRRLRSVALQLEQAGLNIESGSLLVPQWAQLALYNDRGGFYRWHQDGLDFPVAYWLLGPVGLYLFLKWGALRRRAFTAIVYLNSCGGEFDCDASEWPQTWGGALQCRAPAAVVAPSGISMLSQKDDGADDGKISCESRCIAEVFPRGGRLVLFDAHAVEHSVAPTWHERWALTIWIHR
eukprot:TRINITY_DN48907_c0_g1_i1.p1 TRINITY_DN48907_c0_g1~~TRINITY_DN48907_c0_g1_i1.p1  ORF type:complete len:435 (+),score=49.81 TRINITY_DN48907_c0_g1_i1:34-1305(+)